MAEITCYRPMNNFNPIGGLDSSCSINALCMERYQPWELGDATRSFMNNNNNSTSTMEQHHRHHGYHESLDSWAAPKQLMQSENFNLEPKSVLDLQTSSFSSQHSFNSVSDCTSTALQTVTDQLLSDEEDSAALLAAASTKCKSNNVLVDQSILTWMELMQSESESRPADHHPTLVADMDLDFDAMDGIANTPASQQGTLEQLCNQQMLSYNSPTLLSQARPSPMFAANIPASQLQGYTVVPTVELLRLLGSQNQAVTTTTATTQAPVQGRPWESMPSTSSHLKWTSTLSSTSTGVAPEQENGLHLVHLLLACAEAIDLGEDTIAEPMLARLRSISTPEGDPMQRIALYFAEALSERLASSKKAAHCPVTSEPEIAQATVSAGDALECDIAYQAYYQILPFQKFTHFTANQALLEVVANYPRIHIVDFNIRQGLQWPSFLQSLALLMQGPPEVRITAVQSDAAAARITGKRLAEFARSLQVPFEFDVIEETLEGFHRGMISSRGDDEALAINCSDILHRSLRKEGKLESLLYNIRTLQPAVVTVLEADANHNVLSFMSRFVQALHYYCALFDSLEATLQRSSVDRLRIESLCFGPEIRSIVALEGVVREVRHVRAEAWQSFFRHAGFHEVPMSRYAADQAQLLLSLYETSDNMPFRLSPEFGGLSLGWQQTPVMVVSSWTC